MNLPKRIFVKENCYQDEKIDGYVLARLETLKFSKDNIVKGLDLNLAKTGDYYIRCDGETVLISKIMFSHNNNDINLERLVKFSSHQSKETTKNQPKQPYSVTKSFGKSTSVM